MLRFAFQRPRRQSAEALARLSHLDWGSSRRSGLRRVWHDASQMGRVQTMNMTSLTQGNGNTMSYCFWYKSNHYTEIKSFILPKLFQTVALRDLKMVIQPKAVCIRQSISLLPEVRYGYSHKGHHCRFSGCVGIGPVYSLLPRTRGCRFRILCSCQVSVSPRQKSHGTQD